jgi:PAS domain S-box-containing protein
LKGALYLENNLASHVFTPERISVLRLLVSQAAISLDHARLYADLVQENNDRKKAEEALRASEERWSMLAENSSAGIALLAPDGRFIAANQALQKMLGYSESELREHTVLAITHGEDRPRCAAVIAKASEATRQVYRLEKRYLHKTGRIIWTDLSVVFIPASGSNSAFFSAVIVDITERQLAEEALQKAQMELAHMSRITTLGELSAAIAHEINQPLAALITDASACIRWLAAENPEEARHCALRIMANGNRAGEIIGRVRALAKKAPPQKERLDLKEVIGEVLSIASSEIRRHRVSLETKFSPDLPPIFGDKIQLQQVLLNLLVNAIEAMSTLAAGPRELVLTARRATAPSPLSPSSLADDQVLVAVCDSGPGLDPAILGRLFDTFCTTKPHGLGMGLAISRTIIEAHGGRLQATANKPQGAVFEFNLPITDPERREGNSRSIRS